MNQITPIKPKDGAASGGRDMATGGYNLRSLEKLVYDCSLQPEWRSRADLSVAYYDGKQLTEQQQLQCVADGLEPRSTNLIGRVINGVLGQEAKSRSDPRIEADTDEISDVVDVLNPALKEAMRESYANMAISMAYGSQVKAGVGWVEVSRAADGLAYPYRVLDVHRNEMWWDWRSRDFLLRDARWIVRMQWHDLDELQARMPKHSAVLEQMSNGWEAFDLGGLFEQYDYETASAMNRAHDEFRRFKVRSYEWFDSVRKRVKVYEVWYKVPASAVVLKISPTRKVLYDENNPVHVMAVSRGLVKVERTYTMQVRKAIFAGPYRLTDEGTTKRNFPYVPFFAFRDDEDGSPYGLIEGMKSPQDEYNERRLRIQWLLKARQIQVDSDALDLSKNNWEDLANNAMRPDMLLILNAARRNNNAVKVENNLQLQQEQVVVMQDAKQLIQDVPGVYSSQLGNAPQGVTSGVALSGLVEQGIISMGELNDNYRHGRQMVVENVVDLLVEDHDTANLKIMIGEGRSKRVVVLNTVDENGLPKNMVKDAPIRVGLSDVPASPAARMQEAQTIGQVISGLANNPQAVMALTPAYLELSSLNAETRRQAVDDIRRMSGLPPGGDKAAQQKQDEAAAEQAAKKSAMEEEAAKVAIDGEKARVAKDMTAAELNDAKVRQIDHEIANPEQPEADPDADRMRSIDEAVAEAG
jgi:hypothetical protein